MSRRLPLHIEPMPWGVFVSCGCRDESCKRHIVVESADFRSLGNRLINLAQERERGQEQAAPDGKLYCPTGGCPESEIEIQDASYHSGTGTFHCPVCDELLVSLARED